MMTNLSKVLRHIHPLLIFVIGTAWKFVVKENRMKTDSFVSCFTVNFWNYIPKERHITKVKRETWHGKTYTVSTHEQNLLSLSNKCVNTHYNVYISTFWRVWTLWWKCTMLTHEMKKMYWIWQLSSITNLHI